MRAIFVWIKSRLRFTISTLVALMLAVNLVIYMNWLGKEPYRALVYRRESIDYYPGDEATWVTNYRIGWPVQFLEARKSKIDASNPNSPLERKYNLISWMAAAEAFGISLVLVVLSTWLITKLLLIVSSPTYKKQEKIGPIFRSNQRTKIPRRSFEK